MNIIQSTANAGKKYKNEEEKELDLMNKIENMIDKTNTEGKSGELNIIVVAENRRSNTTR